MTSCSGDSNFSLFPLYFNFRQNAAQRRPATMQHIAEIRDDQHQCEKEKKNSVENPKVAFILCQHMKRKRTSRRVRVFIACMHPLRSEYCCRCRCAAAGCLHAGKYFPNRFLFLCGGIFVVVVAGKIHTSRGSPLVSRRRHRVHTAEAQTHA